MTGEAGSVAADTNIVRQSTPRRYLTALEALRGRRVAILPMVDTELRVELYTQAAENIRTRCRRAGIGSGDFIAAAQDAAGLMAEEWWMAERSHNRSAYEYLPDRGWESYRGFVGDLPREAFSDENPSDLTIYAQAWAHGVDFLASRNRNSISRELLDDHFTGKGQPSPPVAIRGLYEHTRAVAESEGRRAVHVGLEAMLGAVIRGDWDRGKVFAMRDSCERFIANLAMSEGKRPSVTKEENVLVKVLGAALKATGTEEFIRLCDKAHATRPDTARETEMRYRSRYRALVRDLRIEL